MSKKMERQEVEIARKRVPLKRLIHNREVRDAMAELEKFRQQFNEQEFFYKARVYLQFNYGEAIAVVKRMETDKEYAIRLEKIKAEELERLERQRIKAEKARIAEAKRQAQLAKAAEAKRLEDIKNLKTMVRNLGLSASELAELGVPQ